MLSFTYEPQGMQNLSHQNLNHQIEQEAAHDIAAPSIKKHPYIPPTLIPLNIEKDINSGAYNIAEVSGGGGLFS